MLIISNNTLPSSAIEKLNYYGDLILLEKNHVVYDAISNHPDIFLCRIDDSFIIAPNTSIELKETLSQKGLKLIEGIKPLGKKYPETAIYNAVVTKNYLIGNSNFIDETIISHKGNRRIININQAYTRCNLLPLLDERFITSDLGIYKQLLKNNLEVLYVNPKKIVLKDFANGFIGGCCGVFNNKIFIAGSLNNFPEGEKIMDFLKGLDIIELYDGPLLDVGSILFV
ncbi:MAG: hypothetical protein C0595_08735 [Marinilabiliales bacterium]|nr:MAG: hypothetical protein C0595_08735 [Marinilabiliales bacterium]